MIAVDLAKSVFQVAVSHHTGRVDEEHEMEQLGHTVQLLPPHADCAMDPA